MWRTVEAGLPDAAPDGGRHRVCATIWAVVAVVPRPVLEQALQAAMQALEDFVHVTYHRRYMCRSPIRFAHLARTWAAYTAICRCTADLSHCRGIIHAN